MSKQDHLFSAADYKAADAFEKQLKPLVELMLISKEQKSMSAGVFNLDKEPWRMLAVNRFRAIGLKPTLAKEADGRFDILLLKP